MRNALAHAGKSGRRVVSAFIATAFAQDHADAARAQWRQVADQVRPKLPKLAPLLDEAEEDVLAYMAFPKEHRAKIHSTDEIDKGFWWWVDGCRSDSQRVWRRQPPTAVRSVTSEAKARPSYYAARARATAWRSAGLRLKAPPGGLIMPGRIGGARAPRWSV
jgi:hypothetical protein